MTANRKDQICALLKSIETGEPGPIAVVNQAKYIQHNPQTHEGSNGNPGQMIMVLAIAKCRPKIDCFQLRFAEFDVKAQFLASRKLSKPGLIYL